MNVLIIGLGSIAKKHISAIHQLDVSSKIYALRNNPASTNDIAGIVDVYALKEVNMAEIDFVLISNPTSLHFSTIKALLPYKKPLFIEKPLFSEINEETQSLVAEIETKGIITYVACNLRFLDCLKELKNHLPKERINEVNVYAGSYLPAWRPGVDFRTVYSANKEMGGGVHIDLIHELDYVYWLFGKPFITSSLFRSRSTLEISAIDYANYRWEYENFTASIILNYYRKDSKRTLEVVTEAGTYTVDLLANSITFDNKCIFASPQKITDTYKDQMKYFIDLVLRKNERFNTILEANTILGLCLKD